MLLKNEARTKAKRIVRDISYEQWKLFGHNMAKRIILTEEWKKAKSVFCFVSMSNEPDTELILITALEQNKTLCVPRIIDKGQMEAVIINSLDELVESTMGIREPNINSIDVLSKQDIDLIIVPCLAAAENGARLGKGGGYYDRFLENFSGKSFLLCPEKLIFSASDIPIESHDVFADVVVTENSMSITEK